MLKFSLCNYKEAYIIVRDDITIIGHNVTEAAFKNCASFIKCIKKIDVTAIDDAEDLDLIMPMNNLLEYSSNYSDTLVSLWLCFKYAATNFNADIVDCNALKSFRYKAK